MTDIRQFNKLINNLKDLNPSFISLLENIQEMVDHELNELSFAEKRALKQFPEQFIVRLPDETHEWTTQLHIWAENGVPEILKLNPMLLSFKNSYGDSVLMSMVVGATGAYNEKMNYELISQILDLNPVYQIKDKNEEGKEVLVDKNLFDETDINDNTILDFLTDFAFSRNDYEGLEPDTMLQEILNEKIPIIKKSFISDDTETSTIKEVKTPEINENENNEEPSESTELVAIEEQSTEMPVIPEELQNEPEEIPPDALIGKITPIEAQNLLNQLKKIPF